MRRRTDLPYFGERDRGQRIDNTAMEVDLEHNAGNDDKTVVAARDYQVSLSLEEKLG